MIKPFEFSEVEEIDPIFNIYPNLKISNNSPFFYLILRGIIGSIQIKQTFRDTVFVQSIDYFDKKNRYGNTKTVTEDVIEDTKDIDVELKIGIANVLEILKPIAKSNLIPLERYLSDSFTLEALSNVIKNKQKSNLNKIFFERLNDEFCNFYYFTHQQNHTVAFLHIYRILEFISYTFPVMYASSTKDFSKSFGMLKTLFEGDKDMGELKVFKEFITSIFATDRIYSTLTIDIYITSDLIEYNERIYGTIIDICNDSFFDNDNNVENAKLAVKFTEFSSFIITIRNRFFHLKNSQGNNIHSADIVDSDYFFSLINNKCAYFLSLITVEIIKKSCLEISS